LKEKNTMIDYQDKQVLGVANELKVRFGLSRLNRWLSAVLSILIGLTVLTVIFCNLFFAGPPAF